ncbi:MAG: bifunctional demethylmenaquinone methyltransferase/2-methoxy-6-polyprenyl-1,4-benzoquinol methylase UbiE [Armatimonas sp.]
MEARPSLLPTPEEKHGYVRAMFDAIAPRYDLLNGLLSLSLHHRWRRIAGDKALITPGDSALDVCTGTGDFAIELSRRVGEQGRVVGTDYSEGMLDLGQAKLTQRGLKNLTLTWADTEALPFEDNTFHAATVAFGIRNVADIDKGIREMARVVRPGGRVIILEFTQPKNPLVNLGYGIYQKLMPVLGGLVAGKSAAYAYLPASIGVFDSREKLAERMRNAGLVDVTVTDLNLGTVAIHAATKPGNASGGRMESGK